MGKAGACHCLLSIKERGYYCLMRKLDKNPDITKKAAQCGVFYWQIAMELGVGDATFSRWMRQPLSPELRSRVFEIIDKLSKNVQKAIL